MTNPAALPHLTVAGFVFVSVYEAILAGHVFLGLIEEADLEEMLARMEASRIPATIVIWVERIGDSLQTATDDQVLDLNQNYLDQIGETLRGVA